MNGDKREKVRRTALNVFLQYGYRKVTMDDIAKGAGISRPALYLVYPNREAVFRDVVGSGLDDIIDAVEREASGRNSLEEQLIGVFEVSTVKSFELVSRSPAAAELMNASFDFVADVFDDFERRQTAIIAGLIRRAVTGSEKLDPPPETRARIMIATAHGLKSKVRDVDELRTLLAGMVRINTASMK